MIDTHEHLNKDHDLTQAGPDILQDLFDNYVRADLVVAGATEAAVERLVDAADPDLRARFAGVCTAWERCQHTGYGEAVRLIARRAYGMEAITIEAIEAAAPRAIALRRPGERLRILRDEAYLDHVQIDDFRWQCLPDQSGLDFFLYDLSWVGFCRGQIQAADLFKETGVNVIDLKTLRGGMEALFDKYGACA